MSKRLVTLSVLVLIASSALAVDYATTKEGAPPALALYRSQAENIGILPRTQRMVRSAVIPRFVPALHADHIVAAGGMVVPPDFLTKPLAPGEMISLPDEAPAVYDGAISLFSMVKEYAGLDRWFSESALPVVRPQLVACKKSLRSRGVIVDQRYTWVVALRVFGDGQHAHVTDVLVNDDQWPAIYDDEMRACVTDALAGIRFPATQTVDVTIEWSMCTYPDPS